MDKTSEWHSRSSCGCIEKRHTLRQKCHPMCWCLATAKAQAFQQWRECSVKKEVHYEEALENDRVQGKRELWAARSRTSAVNSRLGAVRSRSNAVWSGSRASQPKVGAVVLHPQLPHKKKKQTFLILIFLFFSYFLFFFLIHTHTHLSYFIFIEACNIALHATYFFTWKTHLTFSNFFTLLAFTITLLCLMFFNIYIYNYTKETLFSLFSTLSFSVSIFIFICHAKLFLLLLYLYIYSDQRCPNSDHYSLFSKYFG